MFKPLPLHLPALAQCMRGQTEGSLACTTRCLGIREREIWGPQHFIFYTTNVLSSLQTQLTKPWNERIITYAAAVVSWPHKLITVYISIKLWPQSWLIIISNSSSSNRLFALPRLTWLLWSSDTGTLLCLIWPVQTTLSKLAMHLC